MNTTATCKYIRIIGKLAINCPNMIGNRSAPIDPEMTIEDIIRLVTVICCSIHKMPHAYTDAIPAPIKPEEMQRTYLYKFPAITKEMLPIEHKVKLRII